MNKIDEIALRVERETDAQFAGQGPSANWLDAYRKALLAELSKDTEPVGMFWHNGQGKWVQDTPEHRIKGITQPLYTHPAPVIASEQKPIEWTPGPNVWKDWCSQWFGPDSDDTYLAKAVFELPPMARVFKYQDASPPNTADIEQLVAEACAKFVSQGARDLAEQYGSDDMGSLSFGGGLHGEARFDRYNELMELDDEIRSGKWREYL